VLENIRGTLTLSDYNLARILSFTIFLYKSYIVAKFRHFEIPSTSKLCLHYRLCA